MQEGGLLQCSALHSLSFRSLDQEMDLQGWVPSVMDREAGEGAQAASQHPEMGALDQETIDE